MLLTAYYLANANVGRFTYKGNMMELNEGQIENIWAQLQDDSPHISNLSSYKNDVGCLSLGEVEEIQELGNALPDVAEYFDNSATVMMFILVEAGEQIYWEDESDTLGDLIRQHHDFCSKEQV